MEQHHAVASRIEQLQATDLPAALQGLLKQAQAQLKPPSRHGTGGTRAPPPAPPAARQALVAGLLLVLERAALLSSQHRDENLVKDVHAQLVSAFQQHGWLWELLLRKHVAGVVQHPAAAQLLAGALAQLPASAQARALHLWHGQLLEQPDLAQQVPRGLAHLWLQQLSACFQARSVPPPLLPGLLAPQHAGEAAAGIEPVALAAGSRQDEAQPAGLGKAGGEVRVVLCEQLPHLLRLLLLVACTGTASAGASDASAGSAPQPGAPNMPSLSSMQSAATDVRPPRGGRQQQQQQAAKATTSEPSLASAGSGGTAAVSHSCSHGSGEHVREGVLRHAVVMISQLRDPDALHAVLGTQAGPAQQHGSEEGAQEHQERRRQHAGGGGSAAAAAAASAMGTPGSRMSRQHIGKVHTAQALLSVCLDGMLALPPLAAAVQHKLGSKGHSSGGTGQAAAGGQPCGNGGEVAAGVGDAQPDAALASELAEQAAAAEAELRHTAGVMLGMHRELSRFTSAAQSGLAGALGAAGSRRQADAPALSLPACERLMDMMASVPQAAGSSRGTEGGEAAGAVRGRQDVSARAQQHGEGSLALLLMPPQLVCHGMELIRHAVEAHAGKGSASGGGGTDTCCADLAQRAAAVYAACYQAMWGAKVLQSAEAYQLLLSGARLRMLLRSAASGGSDAGGSGAAGCEAEAEAEAALLKQHAVGGRQRRQRSNAHELQGVPGRVAVAPASSSGAPPAKRAKLDAGGTCATPGAGGNAAVAELLQLFQAPGRELPEQPEERGPATGTAQQQQQQQQSLQGRRRIVAAPISTKQQAAQQEQQQEGSQPARKRITPQQVAPAPDGMQLQQTQQRQQSSSDRAGPGAQPHAGAVHGASQVAPQRVVISKASNMTDEEQEALWEAYIADKEFLAEMLGDSDYQQWYDEAAHPLRRQQRRPGGLEAAWAAVLGPSSGASGAALARPQLPRTLLEASSSMPWDACAAACLRLLHALLAPVGAARHGAGGAGAAGAAGLQAAAAQQQQQQQLALLDRAFGPELREAGARAATRIAHIANHTALQTIPKAAQTAPASGAMVSLAAQLLALAEGHNYLGSVQFGRRAEVQLQQAQSGARQGGDVSRSLLAPPLLDAYAQLLSTLLPAAHAEGSVGSSGRSPKQPLLGLCTALVQKLLLLAPPVQHMLGPASVPLLRLAVQPGSEWQQEAQQHAGLLWMLLQQQLAGSCGTDEVALPPDCPAWLKQEKAVLLPTTACSRGHVLLLGPEPAVRQAAAAELLVLLREQAQAGTPICRQGQMAQRAGEEQQGDDTGLARDAAAADECGWSAEGLLPPADACCAAIQLLLAEHKRRAQRMDDGDADDGSLSEEEEEELDGASRLPPLLLDCKAAVAGLAVTLCQAGATAAAELAVALDRATTAAQQRRKQRQQAERQQPGTGWAAAEAAAAVVALCNQVLQPADGLLRAGCLPALAQQQLQAVCESLEAQLQSMDELLRRLPVRHALMAAVAGAMETAPCLWQPTRDGNSGREGPRDAAAAGTGTGGGGGAAKGATQGAPSGTQRQQRRKQRRKRVCDVRNPAVRAMLEDDGGCGELDATDLSDLEDFIVCNPERDYGSFFRENFFHVKDSESEGEGEEEAREADAGAAEQQGQQGQPAQQPEPQVPLLAQKQGQQAAGAGAKRTRQAGSSGGSGGKKPGSSSRRRGHKG